MLNIFVLIAIFGSIGLGNCVLLTKSVVCSVPTDCTGLYIADDIAYISSYLSGAEAVHIGDSTPSGDPLTDYCANELCISGKHVYLAGSDDNILYIVNAVTGLLEGQWDEESDAFGLNGVCVSGDYAYVLEAKDISGLNPKIIVLNIQNPAQITKNYEEYVITGGNAAQGISISGNKIYVATVGGIDVFSIGSLGSLAHVGLITGFDCQSGLTDLKVVENKMAYCTCDTDKLYIYDISNTNQVTRMTDYYANNGVTLMGVFYYGGKIYIIDADGDFAELRQGTHSVTIALSTAAENSQIFSFSSEGLGEFTLDHNSGSTTIPATRTFSNVANGYYIIHQDVPSSWALSNIVSSDASKTKYSSDGSSWHSTFAAGDT